MTMKKALPMKNFQQMCKTGAQAASEFGEAMKVNSTLRRVNFSVSSQI